MLSVAQPIVLKVFLILNVLFKPTGGCIGEGYCPLPPLSSLTAPPECHRRLHSDF